MAALAGANLIYGLGMLESGVTFDYGQLVMDVEFAEMIKYTVHGLTVNDESLAVDVIKRVGPFKEFLTAKHTFDHMRRRSQPKLMDRRVRQKWEGSGGKTMYERALGEARQILADHRPDPLPDGVLKEMKEIVNEAEKELGVVR